jgi:fucose permease
VAVINRTNQPDILRVGIAYLSFVIIGMPGAMLGVAFDPAIRDTFGLRLDALGALLAAVMGSYFVASFISGRLVARFGVGKLLAAASALTCIGLLGYVIAPAWAFMVACGVLVGSGAALIDATMNIYFAAHYGPRLMNWLHASFGLGAALSPLLMTFILKDGGIWRSGYIILALSFAVLAVLFAMTRVLWTDAQLATDDDSVKAGAPARATLMVPLVWIGISFFFLYGGQETIPGSWAFSLFTDARRVSAETAGLMVSIYWASFTIGRVIFGLMVGWLKARTLLNICVAGTVIGALLFWWRPAIGGDLALNDASNIVAFIGLAIFGFTVGPIFALIITSTQERLGPRHAPNAIGFQVAAASIGGGLLPGLAGILATNNGLEIVPVFLLGITFVAVVLYIASTRPALSLQTAQPVPVVGD